MEQSFFQNKNVRMLGTLVLIGAVAALGAYTYLTLKQAKGTYTGATTINVSGEGEVLAKPDIGAFTFTVQTEGADAVAAQNQNATVMDAVVAYLKEQGVAETDIKTENYTLNPKYRYEERVCAFGGYCPPSEPIPDGFEVYQNVKVKVRDLAKAGTLIGGVGEKGATNISSLEFTIDDETALRDEARADAIADAKAKAEVIAENLGMELGKLVGFYENEAMPYYGGYGGDMMAREMAAPAMDAVLPMGENTITANVTLTYELK